MTTIRRGQGRTPFRRRVAALALAVVTAATAAPAETNDAAAAPRPLRIVTSFYPICIAALNVARDLPGVTVANMARPLTGCLHDYQLTPGDLVTLSRADVFVVNGAGMESFMEKAVQQMPGLRVVDASRGIALRSAPGGEPNAHVWVSVSLHARQVANIADGLAAADPARAALYRRGADRYIAELDALGERMRAALRDVRTRDIITLHEAFPYFASEFGLTVAAVIEREPGTEPSARELAGIIEQVRRAGTRALFVEPQYPSRSADAIARETGARVWTLDPAVTGPMATDAYVRIMERNLATLRAALR